jgi:peptide deformylase
MTVQKILLYPEDKITLRARSEYVHQFNEHNKQLIEDLKDTLLAHTNGIGLAAPQINNLKRVVVVRLESADNESHESSLPIALINPEIIAASDERRDFDGCLSFPGLYGETVRPHYLEVSGFDENGEPFHRNYESFDAVVVHHEIDHLNGVLFIDRIEKYEDLYRIYIDENGKLVKKPASQFAGIRGLENGTTTPEILERNETWET